MVNSVMTRIEAKCEAAKAKIDEGPFVGEHYLHGENIKKKTKRYYTKKSSQPTSSYDPKDYGALS